ncbi:hypothetical protein [Candidatus Uabimicrobium amorphum]|uniref:Uncharacterized protein n=1 Tax=Uabimicrobium amorphum TaxID=2596890 RepID=A0A5S9IIK6_UABAM|nr:hypothetical protein [Candidatus Uabimicrobium amorphum]BBM82499.1 hypothetical protein UABAM_00842 [Candidatus Uabimicrobium amorphum]
MAKKNPVTAIQEAIEEEEKEQQPRKIRLYTIIVGLCCLVNLFILPMSATPNNQTLSDTEIPIEIDESIEQIRQNITEMEKSVENFASNVPQPSQVKSPFEKKMGKSIELIVQRLLDMETSLNAITESVKEIRKEVVYLEQKQIEIKEDLRKK